MENKRRRNRKKKVVKFDRKRLQKFLKNASDFTSNVEKFAFKDMDSPALMDKLNYVNNTFKKLEIERKKLHSRLNDDDFELMKKSNHSFFNLKWVHQDASKRISQASFKLSKQRKEENFWNKTVEDFWVDEENKSDVADDRKVGELEDEKQNECMDKEPKLSGMNVSVESDKSTNSPQVFEFKLIKERPLPKDSKLFIIPSIYAPDEHSRRELREEENEEVKKVELRSNPGTSRSYLISEGLRKLYGPERKEFDTDLLKGLYSDSD